MAVVKGTNNGETLNGSHDSDVIYGYGGDDTLIGGRGRNTLIGGEGADFLNGLYGLDTASYADSDEGVFVSLRSGSGIGGTAQGDTFLRIENITGSNYS